MFTESGKNIISKYLLGQIPAFASYIALGSGNVTNNPAGSHSLDFETVRAQIMSRGYVNDNGILKMILVAELPTDERYEFTELGLFPAQMNDTAGSADSRNLLRFTSNESWTNGSSLPILDSYSDSTDSISDHTTDKILFLYADNPGLESDERIARLERPRFLNQSILVRGNNSNTMTVSGLNIDLSKNSPSDKIKLAYSVISDAYDNDTAPTASDVSVLITFKSSDGNFSTYTVSPASLSSSRYKVSEFLISDLIGNVSLSSITSIDIQASISGSNSSDYWIALDGLRLDADTLVTGIYDLVAYKTIFDGVVTTPIVKDANTSNLVEFRFAINVDDISGGS